eukprot:jgi/Tetstr1/447874/TSEL_035183.t1
MLPSGAREPPSVPRGPSLRYYLTTVSADDSLNVSDGVKLNGPLTTARLCEASITDSQAAEGLEEAGFRMVGGGLIQLYIRPTAVSRISAASVTGLGSAVTQLTI